MVKFSFVVMDLNSKFYEDYDSMCKDLETIINMFPNQIIPVEILKKEVRDQ